MNKWEATVKGRRWRSLWGHSCGSKATENQKVHEGESFITFIHTECNFASIYNQEKTLQSSVMLTGWRALQYCSCLFKQGSFHPFTKLLSKHVWFPFSQKCTHIIMRMWLGSTRGKRELTLNWSSLAAGASSRQRLLAFQRHSSCDMLTNYMRRSLLAFKSWNYSKSTVL